MSRALAALVIIVCAASRVSAGPNAGGTIFVHDPQYAITALESDYCGLGIPAVSCAGADVELDGSSSPDVRVWKCYAAFWNPPRLKSIEFGIRYPEGSTGISILQQGPCIGDIDLGAAEFPGGGWPGSNTGDIIVFQYTQTSISPIEFYWFAGYTKSASAHNIFELRDHPDPGIGGHFRDDSLPGVPDPIAGYGSLGFDTPGSVSCPTPPGACCMTDGNCLLTWQIGCDAPNTWNGSPACEPNPCPPGGACCAPDGTCVFVEQSLCSSGDWLANVPCSPNPCPQPGACCLANGGCDYVLQSECLTGNWIAHRSCSPNPCPQPGACCASDGTCTHIMQSECTTGTWIPGATCSPNPCPQPGACCAPDGTCTFVLPSACTGDYLGAGIPCSPNPCPQLGACCYPDGHCVFTTESNCSTGDWRVNVPCDPNPCPVPPPYGACCFPDGQCTYVLQAHCSTLDWRSGVPCDPNPCPQPSTGACCIGGNCTITSPPDCHGEWMGPNSTCCPNPCPFGKGMSPRRPLTAGISPAGSLPRGHGVSLSKSRDNPCNGSLLLKYDGSAETGYCWSYGGIAPPYYGAFAECYNFSGDVCGISLYLSGVGSPCNSLTAYVWADDNGVPGNVLSVTTGLNPCPVAIWPEVSEHDFALTSTAVNGNFWIGYWADFRLQDCGYYIAADLNGFGGCPMTNVACGLGYPTGWQSVAAIWGPTQALGIGAWVNGGLYPSGACCSPDGHCTYVQQSACGTGDWRDGVTCDPNPCPQPPSGACCYPDGHCVFATHSNCWTGDWRVDMPCDPNPCPPPSTGACCVGTSCSMTTQADCSGSWLGPGVSCDPNPCECGKGVPAPGSFAPRPQPSEAKAAGSIGRGHGVAIQDTRSNPGHGFLLLNYDGTAENGYCWQYGGVVPPYYGAFAECYSAVDAVRGIELMLTGIGYPCFGCDLYVWDDAGGVPGNVLSVTRGVNPCPVATWPCISTHDFAISDVAVNGNFWVGYWANAANSVCPYFVAADLDGAGGCPFNNVAPGIGYPTGWQNVSTVWGPTQALGIGAWVGTGGTPTRITTWGRIKHLYR